MIRIILTSAALAVGASALAADLDVIEHKNGANASQVEELIVSGPDDKDGSSILSALVAGPFPGAGYSMSMAAAAKPIVLDVVSTAKTKVLKLTDTKSKLVVAEWTIEAKTAETERAAIAKQIAESMALNPPSIGRFDDTGRTDAQASQ